MCKHIEPKKSAITDVAVFITTLTDGYVQLTQLSNLLKSQIDILTPQAIQSECEKLTLHQNELNLLDDQLIDILGLTGADSSVIAMIDAYSIALHDARIASDKLYDRLADLKKNLLKQATES